MVTVNVYVPDAKVAIVVVSPVPVIITPPGLLVSVHVPVEGKPLKSTLPVDNAHVGCTIVPITGAVGADGGVVITALADTGDIHPAEDVTIKV